MAKFCRRATWSFIQNGIRESVQSGSSDGAEVNELIDFTFAELNRRVGRAGVSPGQHDNFDIRQVCSKTISLIPT